MTLIIMLKIILVRHGETFDNVNHIVQGHKPGHLTRKGFLQAKKAGMELSKLKIDKIYVSDLQRTVQTAAEIIKYLPDIPVLFDSRLRERNYGVFEGSQGLVFRQAAIKAGKSYIEYKPKDGESIPDLYERAKDFIKFLIKKEKNQTILIVTHGGFIVSSLLHLMNDGHDNFQNALTSISQVGSGQPPK